MSTEPEYDVLVDGKTALMRAIEDEDKSMIKKLIRECVNIETKDENGETALFYAIRNNNAVAVDLLLKDGANMYSKNTSGETPMDLIFDYQGVDVIRDMMENIHKRNASDHLHSLERNAGKVRRCYGNSKEYTHNQDREINDRLRRAKDGTVTWETRHLTTLIDIYKGLSVMSSGRDRALYRGVLSHEGFDCRTAKKGDKLTLRGFASFTIYEDIAMRFGRRGCILIMIIPRNTPLLYLDVEYGTSYYPESEVLLHPNLEVEVVDVTEMEIPANYLPFKGNVITLKLIGEGTKNIGDLPGIKEWYSEAKRTNTHPEIVKELAKLGVKEEDVPGTTHMSTDAKIEDYFRAMYLLASQYEYNEEQYRSFIQTLVDNDEKLREYADELFEASQFLRKYRGDGVVVLKHIYPREECKAFVDEFWEYILSLPYKPEIKGEVEGIIEELHLRDNPWRSITKRETEELKKYYPMTGGFGALTMPPAFHLKGSWKARQDPVILSVFRALLGYQEIETALDRVSFKLPGQGETEFTHWDSNPWSWPDEEYEGIQGILSLSETSFRAVPSTHTEQFRREFIAKYPKNKRHDQYYVGEDKSLRDVLVDYGERGVDIPPRKERENDSKYAKRLISLLKKIDNKYKGIFDPMKLREKVQTYPIGIGDLVVWSNRLLHEARQNKTTKIRYAMYLSYYPAGKPSKNALLTYKKAGVDYYQDRIDSYTTGKNPFAFPSGTEVKLWSKMAWAYRSKPLLRFCSMWEGGKTPCINKPFKAGGSWPIVQGWDPLELGFYSPPKLTKEGWRILGRDVDNDETMTINGELQQREIRRCGE